MQEKRRSTFITGWDSEWEDTQAVGWGLIEYEEELKGEFIWRVFYSNGNRPRY